MNQEITDYVSQCSVCNIHRLEQCKEPMVPHDVPGRPCAKVGADCRDSTTYCWSTISPIFFELMRLSSSTRTKCVINAMRPQFASHGVPEVVMSDNGQ